MTDYPRKKQEGRAVDRVVDSSKDCRLLHSNLLRDDSALVLLQSRISDFCRCFSVSPSQRERMMMVAAEMVTNVVKHAAGKGQIQLWQHPGPVLDIVAIDYGPGILDLKRAASDGYSTTKTFGKGLGVVQRMSDQAFFYSQTETSAGSSRWTGLAVMSRFDIAVSPARKVSSEIGIFSRSLSDERFNGDRIYLLKRQDKLRWLHMDGIGHGEEAAFATSNMASHLLREQSLLNMLEDIDQRLFSTRGAVAVSGDIQLAEPSLSMCGVGDMHTHIVTGDQDQQLLFAPGILGREHRSVVMQQSQLKSGALIVSASDGIRRNWDVTNFSGLFEQPPQLIAYILGNIMGRVSDDQSVFVCRV